MLHESADCSFNYKYAAKRHGLKSDELKKHGLKSDGLKKQRVQNQGLLFNRWQDKGTGAGTLGTEEFNGDIADA